MKSCVANVGPGVVHIFICVFGFKGVRSEGKPAFTSSPNIHVPLPDWKMISRGIDYISYIIRAMLAHLRRKFYAYNKLSGDAQHTHSDEFKEVYALFEKPAVQEVGKILNPFIAFRQERKTGSPNILAGAKRFEYNVCPNPLKGPGKRLLHFTCPIFVLSFGGQLKLGHSSWTLNSTAVFRALLTGPGKRYFRVLSHPPVFGGSPSKEADVIANCHEDDMEDEEDIVVWKNVVSEADGVHGTIRLSSGLLEKANFYKANSEGSELIYTQPPNRNQTHFRKSMGSILRMFGTKNQKPHYSPPKFSFPNPKALRPKGIS